ncbi:hypothetical protein GA0115240_10425 [Streptomyces sp. DvalAA-14]|uniref:DUF5709 domain-containing protein n=1 Tax=unclassified Streptomyces TaxID=2593676 RepID=UPI00081B0606|nr:MULTISPECIES: DUF5709 domain-containing protein [unclassified Streptomyces]MYS19070.1 hypothetical protein [Streptomyces sp. SID4948]SCD35812.1 hypothetical protein GA0115240_10425 [Streptomyces sp. DvalAA-14]
MTTPSDGAQLDGSDGAQDPGLLRSQEGLDDEETGGFLDEGYSPVERPLGVGEWGITAGEAASHEDLDHRLAREVAELDPSVGRDGLGDASDTDGELIDDEVGDLRAGRLVARDGGDAGLGSVEAEYWAQDVGIDGGAASAEEAAVHIVPESELDDF